MICFWKLLIVFTMGLISGKNDALYIANIVILIHRDFFPIYSIKKVWIRQYQTGQFFVNPLVKLSFYCCLKIILLGMVKTLWSSLKTLAITMPSDFWRSTETNSACSMMIFKVNTDLCNLNHSCGFNQWGFLFYCVSIN